MISRIIWIVADTLDNECVEQMLSISHSSIQFGLGKYWSAVN